MKKLVFILFILIISGCAQEPSPETNVTVEKVIEFVSPPKIVTLDVEQGYELFFDGKRVGHEPNWSIAQAIDNFRGNKERYLDIKVEGLFNNETLSYINSVEVLPIFFVASDVDGPTANETQLFQKHLSIAQSRFEQMLKSRDTFRTSLDSPIIYKSKNNLEYFTKSDDMGAAKFVVELLEYYNINRYNVPYVFLVVVMNPYDSFPVGGGRPINGGFNRGGSIVIMSSLTLNGKVGWFQSTLQHELGHSFGLPHVLGYGYDTLTSDSIMSYNPNHQWDGLNLPAEQGILIPEDLKALDKNKLVFPNFYFNSETDIPPDYEVKNTNGIVPMSLSTKRLGYQLFFDGVLVGQEPEWNSKQAIQNLLLKMQKYSN